MPENKTTSIAVRLVEAFRRRFGHRFPPLGSLAYRTFFKVLPHEIDVELLPGIQAHLNTKDGTQRATYWQGARFETPTGDILKTWSDHPDTVFFDIGSNYGWFSLYLTNTLPLLEIHAFEPNPPTFERLQGIVTRNRLDRIHPWNLGLGDAITKCRLRIGVEDSGHSTFGPHPELDDDNAVELSITTFDAWRVEANLPLPEKPRWVAKIDVEGFECRVISGMREALSAKAFRGLAIEVNRDTLEFCGDSEQKLIDLLASLNYVERPAEFANERAQMNKFFVPCR